MLRVRMLLSRARAAVLVELLGTAALVGAVVGSGIAAVRLTDDVGLQLLLNAVATVAVLGVLVHLAARPSGAHFNPAVTVAAAVRGGVPWRLVAPYVAAQLVGACAGTVLAHAMFEVPLVTAATVHRSGFGQLLGEVVATAGLVIVAARSTAPALAVPSWIGGAYLFTSSTSFANPAVTVARALTDTFAGIRWVDVPLFVVAQVVGAACATALLFLLPEESS